MVDNQVIINTQTYDLEDEKKYFNCDKEIGEAISILNKKGYYTLASCAGHIDLGYGLQEDVDISFLEEIIKDERFILLNKKENTLDVLSRHCFAQTYVSFKESYSFPFLPDGFTYQGQTSKVLEALTWYYINDGQKRKNHEDIEKELKKYQENLLIWAKKLPDNK